MNKYTRRQINKKASLHGKEFVTYDDATKAMMQLLMRAVKAGADETKLMEFLSGGSDE